MHYPPNTKFNALRGFQKPQRVYERSQASLPSLNGGTCIIESVHRQFRKLTKTKVAFPNENSLLKLLYMGIKNA